MAGRRSRRSGIGVADAVPGRLAAPPRHSAAGTMPIPWVDPQRRTHARQPRPASRVASVVGFVLMSLLVLFGAITYVGTLAGSTYDQLGGGIGITFLTVVLVALLLGWLASFRAMRKRLRPPGARWEPVQAEPVRRGRGRVSTLLKLKFGRRPARSRFQLYRQHYPEPADRAPGISAPRTDLRPSDISAAKRLSIIDRPFTPTVRGPAKPIAQLAGIERSIGDALYQLDLAGGRHELTRSQITELRRTGLAASAWLSGHAHRVDPLGHPLLTDQQLADGIARYDALAQATGQFLAGQTDLPSVLHAGDRLRALVDPIPAP